MKLEVGKQALYFNCFWPSKANLLGLRTIRNLEKLAIGIGFREELLVKRKSVMELFKQRIPFG